ncbi:unnamed protein product [Paramecium primaurelia]|uniref:Uncharacterized protein n=1 Tax=Paramecium primaurelia TaxID=5886 RepID=A0A8S1MA96_PARPR|nr:unnamed protein product [Paramecium primaurelia]
MDPQKQNFDQSVKILLIGDVYVGKTQLIYRYCENIFLKTYLSTIGVDIKEKSIDIEGKKILMKIWDSSGKESFEQYTLSGYKGASAIILVYSINDRKSFNNVITYWKNQIKQYASENVCILLIGFYFNFIHIFQEIKLMYQIGKSQEMKEMHLQDNLDFFFMKLQQRKVQM